MLCYAVLGCLSHVQLFAAPWTIGHQALLSIGFSLQEYWNGLPCPPPGDLPNPGIEPESPALQVDSLSSESPVVKNLPAMQETQEMNVQSLSQEDSLEEGMATHSSILA